MLRSAVASLSFAILTLIPSTAAAPPACLVDEPLLNPSGWLCQQVDIQVGTPVAYVGTTLLGYVGTVHVVIENVNLYTASFGFNDICEPFDGYRCTPIVLDPQPVYLATANGPSAVCINSYTILVWPNENYEDTPIGITNVAGPGLCLP